MLMYFLFPKLMNTVYAILLKFYIFGMVLTPLYLILFFLGENFVKGQIEQPKNPRNPKPEPIKTAT